ncbi:MAG TPA: glutathione S-transferase [Halieaceae bacterium]|jgi:glutathione S-transferase|uniref:glutathione S-transferase family protein n=1 Tax=Haliea TaxID=475794 RepID=UPI000C3D9082|nr:glutathione S-transferase family protein [Haliea sp.]HBM83474.1 glutathione S-transferase [Halieaceae bacterium]MAD62903.1 glutathione S-transferase [Haliea sp.]MAY94445.1 glutathione S-transferase [Haliea sp.]MBP70591.1 glutathione S-transferase [Haliea sp.]HBQ40367.1 glutathione S-transferase [Halieaceae bacterium]|tara:strand:+ start:547 stop:1179 length:633 start_codon:yes stop_codon:yes gene_type:complete
MKLWHCGGARSLRPLWTLEELGLDYELEVLPFPPRVMQPDYLQTNSLGTVPYFTDGDTVMTESSGICQYLVDRYGNHGLGLRPEDPEYGAYLNWLHHSDATLTFPLTIALRYYFFEPDPAKRTVADDYAKWFRARLRRLDECVEQQEYLVAGRFTIADIAVGYALFLGQMVHLDKYYKPATAAYLQRLMARPAFQRANAHGEPLVLPDVV